MKASLLKYDKLDQQLYYSIKGNYKEANKIINELLIERPDDPKVIYNSASYFLKQGDIKEGMDRLNNGGRSAKVFGNSDLPYPLLPNKNIKNKTILINLEGGLGDNLLGLKFARELSKYNKIIILSPKSLHYLLDCQEYIYRYYVKAIEVQEHIDYWLPSFASEMIFNYTNFNQLPRDPHIFYNHRNDIKSNKFKIGVKFRGGTAFDHDKYRSPQVIDIIRTLSSISNVELYSLEKDVIDLPKEYIRHDIKDFRDTCNIIQQMDLVISTCTSIAHLSAGLGQKTFIMIPVNPYWIWVYPRKNNSSWYYKDVTLFQQTRFQEWNNTLQNVKNQVEKIK